MAWVLRTKAIFCVCVVSSLLFWALKWIKEKFEIKEEKEMVWISARSKEYKKKKL